YVWRFHTRPGIHLANVRLSRREHFCDGERDRVRPGSDRGLLRPESGSDRLLLDIYAVRGHIACRIWEGNRHGDGWRTGGDRLGDFLVRSISIVYLARQRL